MDEIYLKRRQKKSYTSYRLEKRIEAIIDSLKGYTSNSFNFILDVGTADGKMLKRIATHLNIKKAIGIDISKEAIKIANQQKNIRVSLGNFIDLPFKEGVFDVLLASAVVEHIEDVDSVLKESYRVLKNGGLFCVTLPNPFFDWINSKLVKTYHIRRYWLKEIMHIMENFGFRIVKAHYFMLCPFGQLPFAISIEKFFRFLRLDFLLFNHITIGKKI